MEYCLDCGLRLKGREDKKFCSVHCRTHYHNVCNKNSNSVLREINSILKRNTNILKKLSESRVTKLTRNRLSASGFNFDFFTHQEYGLNGEVYNYCYEYGYFLVKGTNEVRIFSPL